MANHVTVGGVKYKWPLALLPQHTQNGGKSKILVKVGPTAKAHMPISPAIALLFGGLGMTPGNESEMMGRFTAKQAAGLFCKFHESQCENTIMHQFTQAVIVSKVDGGLLALQSQNAGAGVGAGAAETTTKAKKTASSAKASK